MKKSLATVFKRREKILMQLRKNGVVYVDELAKEFQVSPLTIRRDLELFEKKHMIVKEYGKATYTMGTIHEYNEMMVSQSQANQNKKRIVAAATNLVKDGMTIFINAGVISLALIQAIAHKNVTIFTNNVYIIQADFETHANINLIGGELNERKVLVGDVAIQTLTTQKADICFLEVDALDEEMISVHSLSETLINRTMFEFTVGKKIVLVEGENVGKQTNFMIVHNNLISSVITNKIKNKKIYNALINEKIEVNQV